MNTPTPIRPGLAFALLLAVGLAACQQDTGPGPEIHDSKYVAVDAAGAELAAPEGTWPCVLDRYTGLTWEVKSGRPGLRDWRNSYSWWDPDEANDELDYRGTPNGGQCDGSDCDTHAFVQTVNAMGLCGFRDWRMPTRDELASISDPRKIGTPPTANTAYFPFMQADEYWSGNDYAFQWNAAWVWNFEHGHDRVEWKATPRHVRLVRGAPQHVARVKD